jgi:hypothetical protein
MSGKCLVGTVIEINDAATQNVSFNHKMEVF